MADVVVWVAHADDESATHGGAVATHLQAGDRVVVALCTDGGGTRVAPRTLNGEAPCGWHGYVHDPAAEGYAPLDRASLVERRDEEFRAACRAVGVPAGDVVIARQGRPDRPRDGGLGVEEADALMDEVLRGLDLGPRPGAATGPEADVPPRHLTHTDLDGHPDHAALGTALRRRVARGHVVDAGWYVKAVEAATHPRPWVAQVPPDPAPVRAALDVYLTFDPPDRLGVGGHSALVGLRAARAEVVGRLEVPA